MNTNEILAKINAVEGLTATMETAENCARSEHVGLVLVEVDSDTPRFRDAIKHDAVGDVIDAALFDLGLNSALMFVDSDEAASEAWYRLVD